MSNQYIEEIEKEFTPKSNELDTPLEGEIYTIEDVESIIKSVTNGDMSYMLRCQPLASHTIKSLCKTIIERGVMWMQTRKKS